MQRRRRNRRTPLLRPQSRQALERRDLLPAHSRHRSDARADLLPVQKHRASATLRKAATKARAMQVELVVQDVQERRIEARGDVMNETVDLDLQSTRHTTLRFEERAFGATE